MTASDRELLSRGAAGEADAFEQFVRRHEASVLRFVRALAQDEADAEDALQETFVAAWRAAGNFRGREGARAWILTIARNALRRFYRRRVGEPSEFVSLAELGYQGGWGSEQSLETELTRIEDRALLERALADLSEEDREVLILRDLECFSGEEVAEMIDLSLPAMKSRLHRARLRLTAAVKEELGA